jgi:hypothetical protein
LVRKLEDEVERSVGYVICIWVGRVLMEVRNWRAMRKRRMMQGLSGVRGVGVRIMEGKSRSEIWWLNRGHRMMGLIPEKSSETFQGLKMAGMCHVTHQEVRSGVILVLYRG